jgi:hypothetical protein
LVGQKADRKPLLTVVWNLGVKSTRFLGNINNKPYSTVSSVPTPKLSPAALPDNQDDNPILSYSFILGFEFELSGSYVFLWVDGLQAADHKMSSYLLQIGQYNVIK